MIPTFLFIHGFHGIGTCTVTTVYSTLFGGCVGDISPLNGIRVYLLHAYGCLNNEALAM